MRRGRGGGRRKESQVDYVLSVEPEAGQSLDSEIVT